MKVGGRVLKGLHFKYGLGFERVYTAGALEIHLNCYHSLFTEAIEQNSILDNGINSGIIQLWQKSRKFSPSCEVTRQGLVLMI
jgi:hypothetical protein